MCREAVRHFGPPDTQHTFSTWGLKAEGLLISPVDQEAV